MTKSDGEIVSWIGSVGPAAAEHLMARFGRSSTWAGRHLRLLVQLGFLAPRRLLFDAPGLYVATAKGLRWRGLGGMAAYRVGPGNFEHTFQVASVAAALQVGLPDWRVLGERYLRMREITERRLLASVELGESRYGGPLLHRPDLALISPEGEVWAIEVELTVKGRARLEGICRGWARARHLQGVCYLATPDPAKAVGRVVEEIRAEDRVTVMALEQADLLAQMLRTGGVR